MLVQGLDVDSFILVSCFIYWDQLRVEKAWRSTDLPNRLRLCLEPRAHALRLLSHHLIQFCFTFSLILSQDKHSVAPNKIAQPILSCHHDEPVVFAQLDKVS